jgi:large subunit ribosomal protein L18
MVMQFKIKKQRKLDKRRRRECKTDYKNRLNLLKSESTRIVIRRTNKYFIAQAVDSYEAQDKVVCSVSSKDLIKS